MYIPPPTHLLTLVSFSLLFISLILRLFQKGAPAPAKKRVSSRSDSIINIMIHLLMVSAIISFIVINILTFNFVSYNEENTKYDYSFYLQSIGAIRYGGGYGTNVGGVYLLFPPLYRFLRIDSLFESVLLNKIILSLAIIISVFCVRKILSFFMPQHKKSSDIATIILTLLYVSLPQLAYAYWIQKTYYILAHLFFLISFAFLIKYLESRSVWDFLIYISSAVISFQTRPEFVSFAAFLFAFHLLNYLSLEKLTDPKLKKIGKKEGLLLAINLFVLAIVLYIAYLFFINYLALFSPESSLSLGDNLLYYLSNLFGMFDISLLMILGISCAAALIFYRPKRKFVLLSLIFAIALITQNAMSTRFDAPLYTLYTQIFLFTLLAHSSGWLISLQNIGGKVLMSLLLISLTICSALYLITSENNLVVRNAEYLYSRRIILESTRKSFSTYNRLKDRQITLFDKSGGEVYFSYALKGMNITLLDFYGLRDLDTAYKNDSRLELLYISLSFTGKTNYCNDKKGILKFMGSALAERDQGRAQNLSRNHSEILGQLNRTKLGLYGYFGEGVFCEIIPQ